MSTIDHETLVAASRFKLGDSISQALKEVKEHQARIEKIPAQIVQEAVKMNETQEARAGK